MKTLFLVLAAAILVPIFPLRADATMGQKQVTEKTVKERRKMMATKDDSEELCEAVMRSPRAKARMCEMLKQDPEARRILGLK